MMAGRDSVRLQELRAELRRVNARQRELREAIAQEEAQIEAEDSTARAKLMSQVVWRLESGMTVPQVATALAIAPAAVRRLRAEWRSEPQPA